MLKFRFALSNLIHENQFFLLILSLMSVCNTNADDLLEGIDSILGIDVVLDELTLIDEICGVEIFWLFLATDVVSRACLPCLFESVVLEEHKPYECN